VSTNKYIYIVFICLSCCAFRNVHKQLFYQPKNFPKPVYNFKENNLSASKIELGRILFYDPILSKDNTISCASCHSPFAAFAHTDHALSHGINDRIGFRNSPALMNLAWQKTFMWDGAIHHLEMQALAPISNPLEMDEGISHVVKKLQASEQYPKLFYKSFGDSTITGQHTLKAIAQFLLTLVSANSKYDSVQRKEAIFTEQEKNGYVLFKKNCSSCHTEPLFSNYQFANNGLAMDTSINDFGRMRITQSAADSLLFKVPTLRNIEYTYPYMHDGRFKKLSQVLDHYTSGVMHTATLSKELREPLVLNANEKVDIIAFLLTLSDRSFVFNKQFGFPNKI
jgi:cytochrome c peroxidase